MKVEIMKNQKGIVFKAGTGEPVKIINAGTCKIRRSETCEIFDLKQEIGREFQDIAKYISNNVLKDEIDVITVRPSELGIHLVSGKYLEVLQPGTYYYWKTAGLHSFVMVDTSDIQVPDSISRELINELESDGICSRFDVLDYEYARLYCDHQFVKELEPGVYFFWSWYTTEVRKVDKRQIRHDISGQEVLTSDKITIRVNCFCKFKITDYATVIENIPDLVEQIHVTAQMAIRDFAGQNTLDEILEKKQAMTEYVLGELKKKSVELCTEFIEGGVRDIILPGEIREIMNTVLIASKHAQANVITRREEVASTRSLLNTAKLMEENATLARLKELEYLERISCNIGTLSINGGTDAVSQLLGLVHKPEDK